jgi:hypothetical protein
MDTVTDMDKVFGSKHAPVTALNVTLLNNMAQIVLSLPIDLNAFAPSKHLSDVIAIRQGLYAKMKAKFCQV